MSHLWPCSIRRIRVSYSIVESTKIRSTRWMHRNFPVKFLQLLWSLIGLIWHSIAVLEGDASLIYAFKCAFLSAELLLPEIWSVNHTAACFYFNYRRAFIWLSRLDVTWVTCLQSHLLREMRWTFFFTEYLFNLQSFSCNSRQCCPILQSISYDLQYSTSSWR